MAEPRPAIIDCLRACLAALSLASGFSQTEILNQACDRARFTEMSSLLWQLLEDHSGASISEVARLFGVPEELVTDGLIKMHDDQFMQSLRAEVRKQIKLREIGRHINPEAEAWKARAYRAERELANVRKIAKDGGSWETIEAYLDD